MVTEAVILAGGLGTRLRPVVSDLPKPMAPVAGRPFLEYQLDYLITEGIQHAVLSVGHLWQKIEQHFGSAYKSLTLDYSIESTPLGTGGGVLQAAALCRCDEPLLVLNGDTWFPVSVTKMLALHQCSGASITIALAEMVSGGRYGGIDLDENNRVVNFLSSADARVQLINGGIYLITADQFERWSNRSERPLSLERDLVEAGINNGLVCYGYRDEAPFIDIGVPRDYHRAFKVITQ